MIYDPSLSHFDLDMERGAQGELYVDDIRSMLAKKSGYVEVKTDAWFPLTGRYYIERECRGRDGIWRKSGIETTKSKLWGFVWGRHPDGPLLRCRNGALHWLSWRDRLRMWLGFDDIYSLERKYIY